MLYLLCTQLLLVNFTKCLTAQKLYENYINSNEIKEIIQQNQVRLCKHLIFNLR